MTVVNAEDVRIALNEISEEEVSEKLIEQKIKDAEHLADKKGMEGYPKTKFIRAYAAWKSFIVSNTYSRTDFGDVTVDREWEVILDQLEEEMKEALIEGGVYQNLVIDNTPMFDDRPRDNCGSEDELTEDNID